MKLLYCQVENFGCLCQYTVNFKDGMNVFYSGNGTGKTTLAAFIMSMLYGLEGNARKKLQGNDRKKYAPWQGGPFGGTLGFEHQDRTYRLERFFGSQAREDTFTLYDEATGQLSQDYTENIGLEILGLDKESFKKSIFFPQNNLSVSMTDDFERQITHEEGSLDDAEGFNSAMSLLEKSLKVYKKTGGRGLLGEEENRLYNLQKQRDSAGRSDENIRLCNDRLTALVEQRKSLDQQQKQLEEQERALQQKYTGTKESSRITMLRERIREGREHLAELEEFFPGTIPPEEEIDEMIRLEMQGRILAKQQVTLDDTEEEEEYREEVQHKRKVRARSRENLVCRGGMILCFLLGVLLLYSSLTNGLILILLGAIFGCLAWITDKKRVEVVQMPVKKETKPELSMEEIQDQLLAFLMKYQLTDWEPNHKNLQMIRDRIRDHERYQEEVREKQNELDDLCEYEDFPEEEEDPENEESASGLRAPAGSTLAMAEELEQLQARRRQLKETSEQCLRDELNCHREIEQLQGEASRLEELDAQIAGSRERLASYKEKSRLLELTMTQLQSARDAYAARYHEQLQMAFESYIEYIEESCAGKCQLDVSLVPTVIEKGQRRSQEHFSQGWQELILICTRLALQEAIYEGEKPFLILDDPLVNLDDEKTLKVYELIKSIATERQVLFFTCHKAAAEVFQS